MSKLSVYLFTCAVHTRQTWEKYLLGCWSTVLYPPTHRKIDSLEYCYVINTGCSKNHEILSKKGVKAEKEIKSWSHKDTWSPINH